MLVNQPTVNPSNKATASVMGTLVWALLKAMSNQFLPHFGGDYLWDAMLPVIVGAFAWFTPDAANVQVTAVVNPDPKPAETAKPAVAEK